VTDPLVVHYHAKFAQQHSECPLISAPNDPASFVSGDERYNMSKVLSMFTMRELGRLPAVTSGKVVVNAVSPGE
jgi:retinol dehydrogenase-12